MELPKSIKDIIGSRNFVLDNIGKSDSQVICFDDMVLKIEAENEESNNEHRMLAWLADRLPVPQILYNERIDNTSYILMEKVKGNMLCVKELLCHPQQLVTLLVEALNLLWSIDISNSASFFTLEYKLKRAEDRVTNGLCGMDDVQPETYGEEGFKSPEELLIWLKENKPIEQLVFSHGDFCLPNIFANNGKISGVIDLGRSGVSDKYQDIALCHRSLVNNYSGMYGDVPDTDIEFNPNMLFEKLRIEPDWSLVNYYILLDELF